MRARSLNDGVVVQPGILGGHSATLVLGLAGRLQGGWAVEVNGGANLGLGPDDSLLNVSGGGLGFGGGSLDGCCIRGRSEAERVRGCSSNRVMCQSPAALGGIVSLSRSTVKRIGLDRSFAAAAIKRRPYGAGSGEWGREQGRTARASARQTLTRSARPLAMRCSAKSQRARSMGRQHCHRIMSGGSSSSRSSHHACS